MANTFFLAPTANFTQTSLNGAITNNAVTITLNSVTNVTAPGYAVIDRQNSAGTNTPNSREVIYYTGVSGNNLTGCQRGADSSNALAHNDGAIVEFTPTVGMWNNLATIVSTAVTSDGYLKAIASPVTISRGELTNLVVSSTASVPDMRIGTYLNLSGASFSGVFTSGASGSVLTSLGANLLPMFSTFNSVSYTDSRFYVGTFTRAQDAVSGDVAYTGVGFSPKTVIFSFAVSGTVGGGMGFDNGTVHYYNSEATSTTASAQVNVTSALFSIGMLDNGSWSQEGKIKTLDSDGFTLTWAKGGSPPSATITVFYVALR